VALGNASGSEPLRASLRIRPKGFVGESEGGVYGVEKGPPGVAREDEEVAVDGDEEKESEDWRRYRF
jgi:hypothetical protein